MRWIDLLHRWTGGLIGLLLAIIGLSGAILIHRRAWIMLPHAGDPQIQTTDQLGAASVRVMADATTRPEMLTFADRDFGLDRLTYKGGAGAYADQTGNIVTHWSSQWQRPELWLFDLHHHLLSGEIGETVVGCLGLAGIAFVVTGTLLWWRTRKTFSFRLWPARLTRPAIVRHHRDLGIVMAPLLLLSLVTGSCMVFRPLNALLLGPGAPAAITASSKPPRTKSAKVVDALNWAAMVQSARALFPDAELRSIALPRGKSGVITFRMKQPEEWLAGGRTTVWFAPDNGRMIGYRDARQFPASVHAYNILYPLHAADVGGLPYRIVMTLSGLTLTLLGTLAVWTFWVRKAKPRDRTS